MHSPSQVEHHFQEKQEWLAGRDLFSGQPACSPENAPVPASHVHQWWVSVCEGTFPISLAALGMWGLLWLAMTHITAPFFFYFRIPQVRTLNHSAVSQLPTP